MKSGLIIILILFITGSLSAQSIWYVQSSAMGAGTGQSWSNAFTNLQQALAAAQAGDQVWVAGGTYLPDTGTNRDHPFVLPSGVQLLGGFAGTETAVSQRNITAYPTLLSGNIGSPTDSTDNAYTILYLEYPDSTTLVSGFILERGFAVSDTSPYYGSRLQSGGAVYIVANDSLALPTFDHCVFRNNVALAYGGAIYVKASQPTDSWPTFKYCDFIKNTARLYHGGAIFMTGGNLHDQGREFDHCRFINNKATKQGGGIYVEKAVGGGSLDFFACLAEGNNGSILGGFMSYISAGIVMRSVTLDSCRLLKNYSEFGAAGLNLTSFVDVKTIFIMKNSEISQHFSNPVWLFPVINIESAASTTMDSMMALNNYFHNNHSSSVCSLNSSWYVAFIGNTITENDLGIFVTAPYCYTQNNIARNNSSSAITSTGFEKNIICNNLYAHNGNSQTPYFSLISSYSNIPTTGLNKNYIFNNTFIGNTYTDDHNPNANLSANSNIIYNNIFQGNTNLVGGQVDIPLHIGLDSNYFANNLLDVDCGALSSRSICGPGNILTSDPQFIDASDNDFRLSPCSPAVDAGSNFFPDTFQIILDLNGLPRKINGIVDMGPYESPVVQLSQSSVVKAACSGLSNGSVSFAVVNGCSPYHLSWAAGNQNGLTINNLAAGDYLITITDAQGHYTEVPVNIPGSNLVVAPNIQDASSPTTADGSISLTVSSGMTPYQYLWNTGATSAQISSLLPGTYQVTITDAGGCSTVLAYPVDFTVGLKEINASVLRIFPNPVDTELHLFMPGNSRWQLYSATGSLVQQRFFQPEQEGSISVAALPAGLYQYVVQSERGISTGHLAIMHR